MRLTFHLAQSPDPFGQAERYSPPSLEAEGFVHCTDGAQELAATANRHFGTHAGGLWAVLIDLAQVAAPWRIDVAGSPYPHVYGPVPIHAALATFPLTRGSDGFWRKPDGRPPGAELSQSERARLVERYDAGPSVVRAALAAAGDRLRTSADGGWSAGAVALHLADSESLSGIRLRKLLAEDYPLLQGYDEELYADKLPKGRGLEASLRLVEATRAATVEILRAIGESDWTRCGWHTESGPYSVEAWLRIYADHCHDHADQIRRAAS